MKVIVHNMKYIGKRRFSNLAMINYEDQYYEEFVKVHKEAFRKMAEDLNLSQEDPIFYSREYQLNEKDYTFLLMNNQELIGSVCIKDNHIDRLFVSLKNRKQGYGKQILNFGIASLQDRGVKDIILSVADYNKGALEMYLDNNFIIDYTEECNWS